jgi:parallel beta-helix repeat protein
MAPRIRGFFSYSREDDDSELGGLSKLRESIQRELATRLGLSGKDVELFQDTEKLRTGNDWEKRLQTAVMQSHFFLLVSTPRSFRSESYARKELTWFLEREKQLGDSELIMPLAYLPIPGIDQVDSADIYAATLKRRQYRRWDHLRYADERDKALRSEIDSLARDIGDALGRCGLVSATGTARTSGVSVIPDQAANHRDEASNQITAASQPVTPIHAVPEIVVDPYGRADCRTIAEGIERAVNGERIVVRKGYYYEELVIDRPVEIIGAGTRNEVVIASTASNVITFNTNFGRIAGLTLHNRAAGQFCVDIKQGRLQLEDCDLTSDGYSIIAVHGGADPMILQCNIHDGPQCGLLVFDKGRGTFEDNDIYGNKLANIEVTSEADPIVRRNRIHHGKSYGILVHSNGRGTYEDNDISKNGRAGLAVAKEADPMVRKNRIHDGGAGGVFLYEGARGTFEENDIFANVNAGVEVASKSAPVFRHNLIHDGQTSGVFVHDQAQGAFEDNDIHDNDGHGVAVGEEATPIVRHNRIYNGRKAGIFIYAKGQGTFEDNDIAGNSGAGIAILGESNPLVRRNHIHSGNDDGVFAFENGKGTLESNVIEGNRDKGIRIQSNATPELKDNTVRDNAGDK